MNTEKFILYKFATRSRPARFEETLHTIISNSNSPNYLVLVSIDNDDETMQRFLNYQHENVKVFSGISRNKIDAINRDVEKAKTELNKNWDILVNISDDMNIISDRFDIVLRSVFSESTDLFLHLPDGYQNETVSTMSIIGKDYYNRFKYIYHPSYDSVWCDCEATDVAKQLNKYVYLNERLFSHNHPANIGRHVWDAQYEKNESSALHAKDCLNYNERKQNNFPL